MTTDDGRQWLLGRDGALTLRYLLVAGGILVVGLAILYWLGRTGPWGVPGVPDVRLVWLVAAVGVVLAVVPGYRTDGLVTGWLLASAPFVARWLGPGVMPASAFDEPILIGLAWAVLLGVAAGTVGYGLGIGVRRVREAYFESERTTG